MKLIGVAGAKGVGKDTFYNVLKARLKPVQRVGTSDCILADCSALPGLEGATKEQARRVYQAYGEAAKDLQGNYYWFDRMKPVLDAMDPDKTTIVTGLRYPFEAEWIRDQGGKVVLITKPGPADEDHISEQKWGEIKADYTIENFSSLRHYAEAVVETWGVINATQ
jgi:hypothetical protein